MDAQPTPEQKKAEEEARKKAEEAKKKAELEAKKKAEEEARKKAELEAQKKAEEEARKKAELEAQKKAEEEANKAEAKRLTELGDQAMGDASYAKAIMYYNQAMKLAPSAQLHLKLGKAYNGKGDYSNGATHLKKYLQMMEGTLTPAQVELIKKQIRE